MNPLYCAVGLGMVLMLLLLSIYISKWMSEGFESPEAKSTAIKEFFKKCGRDCKFTDYRDEISADVVEYLEHNRKYRNK